jgi:hypothetical protein
MPCGRCQSNKHVEHVRATFDEGNSDVRFYAGLTGPVAVNAMCYKCSNPACPGVLENMKDHNVSSSDDMTMLARQCAVTFRSTTPAQLQILPPQVRAQFSCVLLRIGGYDLELADLLLSSAANQMQTQLQVAEIWGRNHYRACHDYLAFAHAQQLQAQAGRHRSRIRTAIAPNAPVAPSEVVTPIFPEWEAIPDNTLMGVPSAKALESYVQHAYEHMYRLVSTTPELKLNVYAYLGSLPFLRNVRI